MNYVMVPVPHSYCILHISCEWRLIQVVVAAIFFWVGGRGGHMWLCSLPSTSQPAHLCAPLHCCLEQCLQS